MKYFVLFALIFFGFSFESKAQYTQESVRELVTKMKVKIGDIESLEVINMKETDGDQVKRTNETFLKKGIGSTSKFEIDSQGITILTYHKEELVSVRSFNYEFIQYIEYQKHFNSHQLKIFLVD